MENKTVSISINQLFYIGRQVKASDCPTFSMVLIGMSEKEINALLDMIIASCKTNGYSAVYNYADHFTSALNHGAKFYNCYVNYAIDIINSYSAEIISNKLIQFFNLIFRNIPITEEVLIDNYDRLKQFKFSIFKGNPKLKKSESLKCLTAVSGDSLNVHSENIKTYIRNKTPNKLESFKNVSVNDIRAWPGIMNWKKIIGKLRINNNEYKRLPSDIEAEFAKYIRSASIYENISITQSYDVLKYYYLYCFDLHNAASDHRRAAYILFVNPDTAMNIDKKAYFEIFYELLSNSVKYTEKNLLEFIKTHFLTFDVYKRFINDKFKNFYNSLGLRSDFLYSLGKGTFWSLERYLSYYSTSGFLFDLKELLLNGLFRPYEKEM